MGGFIIVSMGELTKIPLSMLLVNGRLLLKPLVFLVTDWPGLLHIQEK
jgi:hypothetical protein